MQPVPIPVPISTTTVVKPKVSAKQVPSYLMPWLQIDKLQWLQVTRYSQRVRLILSLKVPFNQLLTSRGGNRWSFAMGQGFTTTTRWGAGFIRVGFYCAGFPLLIRFAKLFAERRVWSNRVARQDRLFPIPHKFRPPTNRPRKYRPSRNRIPRGRLNPDPKASRNGDGRS